MTKREKRCRLTAKRSKFAATYRGGGDGVRAARAAGYFGNAQALAVRASECLADERVREIITGRGILLPEPSAARELTPPDDVPTDPDEFFRAVASGRISVGREQIAAMKLVYDAEVRTAPASDEGSVVARLQAKVQAVLRERMDAAGVARRLKDMVREATDPVLVEALKRWRAEAEELAGDVA